MLESKRSPSNWKLNNWRVVYDNNYKHSYKLKIESLKEKYQKDYLLGPYYVIILEGCRGKYNLIIYTPRLLSKEGVNLKNMLFPYREKSFTSKKEALKYIKVFIKLNS